MPDRPEEAKRYNRIKIRLRLVGILFVIAYLVFFQAFVSLPLKTFTFSVTPNFYYALSLYLAFFCILHYILNFPLHFYSSFALEHKFNLSTQNFYNWIKDDIKGSALSLVIFLIFMHVLYYLLHRFDMTWWIWIAAFWFVATVILARVTPIFILPLFFKYYPVGDALKKRIIELSKKCRIKILDVYKIDFSKKTTKLNAAVIGLGKTRRVILADNLINDFNEEEIAGVLAHEFGHHKLLHMWKLIAFGVSVIFFSFYALYLVSSKIVVFLGAEAIYDIKVFPAFMLVLFIVGFATLPLQNGFSRKLEKNADIFALRATRDKDAFISLMKKLADRNLADQNPPKLIKFLFYDHPPISERIKLAENFK